MRQVLNMKRSSEGGVEKKSIVRTTIDNRTICDVFIIHLIIRRTSIERGSVDSLQHIYSYVFVVRAWWWLVATSISRNT